MQERKPRLPAGGPGRPLPGALTRARIQRAAAIAAALTSLAGCSDSRGAYTTPPPAAPSERISLSSPAFADGEAIPERFTCDGADVSPPLRWSGVPRDARELVLLVEDPDAAGGHLIHWTVFGIDPSAAGSLDEDAVGDGERVGENSFGNKRWGGPCPPAGDEAHRYTFLLYALAEESGLRAGTPPDTVRRELDDHGILTRGRLTGTYAR